LKLAWLLMQNAAKAFENALYNIIGLVLWPDALISHDRRFSDGRTTQEKTQKCRKCVYRINWLRTEATCKLFRKWSRNIKFWNGLLLLLAGEFGQWRKCVGIEWLWISSSDISDILDIPSPYHQRLSIQVVARSKVWVCGLLLAGIAVLNSARGKGICLVWVLCLVQLEASAMGRSLVQRSPTECVCVCVSLSVIRCNNNPLHLQWVGRIG
jgi:hypothetical protein